MSSNNNEDDKINVYGGGVIIGKVRRDSSGTPFVVKDIYIEEYFRRYFGEGDNRRPISTTDEDFGSSSTTVFQIHRPGEAAGGLWVMQLNEPGGSKYSRGRFLGDKKPIEQLNVNIMIPDQDFDILSGAVREFRVVVVMCRPEHGALLQPNPRYLFTVTGTITLDVDTGEWSFTWENPENTGAVDNGPQFTPQP